MTAIVAGSGLGLFDSSIGQLNGFGASGRAQVGAQGRELAYVNAVTGNLVLRAQDEFVAGIGLDTTLTRTYNALGMPTDGDNNDSWRLSVYRSLNINALTGTLKTDIYRTGGDGHVSRFVYDNTALCWVSSEGAGSADRIRAKSDGAWALEIDGGRVLETYDAAGKIISQQNEFGSRVAYTYTGNLITVITDQSGQATHLDYIGNKLNAIRVEGLVAGATSGSAKQTLIRVRYDYDTLNRLSTVTTDLTPEDGIAANGQVFVTSYEYSQQSGKVSKVSQSDGSILAITYEGTALLGYKVKTLTDGEGRKTTFNYDLLTRATTVKDSLGNSTVYRYGLDNRLSSVSLPTVSGASGEISYSYDSRGNVISVTDGEGRTVSYEYDSRDNLITRQDALGNIIRRAYSAVDQLISETSYRAPNSGGGSQVTNYVYNTTTKLLRFLVSPEGLVTEYLYDTYGELLSEVKYSGARYTGSQFTLGDVKNWTNTQDRTASQRIDTTRDLSGQIKSVTTYERTDAAGNGVIDGSQSSRFYVYDMFGRLVTSVDPRGNQITAGAPFVTSYVYDGLDRLIQLTDAIGRISLTHYDDAGRSIVTKQNIVVATGKGLLTTTFYNRSGETLSVAQAGAAGENLGTTNYEYDQKGRLISLSDPKGAKTSYFYDERDRQIRVVSAEGEITETFYNQAGQIVAVKRRSTDVAAAESAPKIDLNGSLAVLPDERVSVVGASTLLSPELTITDADSQYLVSAWVGVIPSSAKESVTVNKAVAALYGISVQDQGSSVVLSGSATLDQYAQVLRTATYRHGDVLGSYINTKRSVAFEVSDGRYMSDRALVSVSLNSALGILSTLPIPQPMEAVDAVVALATVLVAQLPPVEPPQLPNPDELAAAIVVELSKALNEIQGGPAGQLVATVLAVIGIVLNDPSGTGLKILGGAQAVAAAVVEAATQLVSEPPYPIPPPPAPAEVVEQVLAAALRLVSELPPIEPPNPSDVTELVAELIAELQRRVVELQNGPVGQLVAAVLGVVDQLANEAVDTAFLAVGNARAVAESIVQAALGVVTNPPVPPPQELIDAAIAAAMELAQELPPPPEPPSVIELAEAVISALQEKFGEIVEGPLADLQALVLGVVSELLTEVTGRALAALGDAEEIADALILAAIGVITNPPVPPPQEVIDSVIDAVMNVVGQLPPPPEPGTVLDLVAAVYTELKRALNDLQQGPVGQLGALVLGVVNELVTTGVGSALAAFATAEQLAAQIVQEAIDLANDPPVPVPDPNELVVEIIDAVREQLGEVIGALPTAEEITAAASAVLEHATAFLANPPTGLPPPDVAAVAEVLVELAAALVDPVTQLELPTLQDLQAFATAVQNATMRLVGNRLQGAAISKELGRFLNAMSNHLGELTPELIQAGMEAPGKLLVLSDKVLGAASEFLSGGGSVTPLVLNAYAAAVKLYGQAVPLALSGVIDSGELVEQGSLFLTSVLNASTALTREIKVTGVPTNSEINRFISTVTVAASDFALSANIDGAFLGDFILAYQAYSAAGGVFAGNPKANSIFFQATRDAVDALVAEAVGAAAVVPAASRFQSRVAAAGVLLISRLQVHTPGVDQILKFQQLLTSAVGVLIESDFIKPTAVVAINKMVTTLSEAAAQAIEDATDPELRRAVTDFAVEIVRANQEFIAQTLPTNSIAIFVAAAESELVVAASNLLKIAGTVDFPSFNDLTEFADAVVAATGHLPELQIPARPSVQAVIDAATRLGGILSDYIAEATPAAVASITELYEFALTLVNDLTPLLPNIPVTTTSTQSTLSSSSATDHNPMAVAATAAATLSVDLTRTTNFVFDAVGRLRYSLVDDIVNGQRIRFVTENQYDASNRIIKTISWSRGIAESVALTEAAIGSALGSVGADERVVQSIYDKDGRVIGVLDAVGQLTELSYDGAGREIKRTTYGRAVSFSSNLSAMTSAATDSLTDQITTTSYNSKNQILTQIDAEGYLTRYEYDLAGNAKQKIRFEKAPASGAPTEQVETWSYDALNRLTESRDVQGTITQYFYDTRTGFLTATKRAAGQLGTAGLTEERTTTTRYDELGRAIETIGGEGSVVLAAGGDTSRYSVKRFYDLAGNVIRAVDQNNVETVYYYDQQNRLRYTVNALGEVSELTYNSFGEISSVTQFAQRVTERGQGGRDTELQLSASFLEDPRNRTTKKSYTLRGQEDVVTDALEFTIDKDYNAFGDQIRSVRDSGVVPKESYRTDVQTYDRRGLLKSSTLDVNETNIVEQYEYDVFGRQQKRFDGLNNMSSTGYDRLGRVISTVDPSNGVTLISYDAFDRVLAKIDRTGQTTRFAYSDTERSLTVVTPEGVTTKTIKNRHGEQTTVTLRNLLGDETTTYSYDKDGRLVRSTKPDTGANTESSSYEYQESGVLIKTTDARGIQTRYFYDSTARLTSRVVDFGTGTNPITGRPYLNLTTQYEFDSFGKTIRVIDPNNAITETLFDDLGRVSAVIVDAAEGGLKVATAYQYDGQGNTVTVREGIKAVGKLSTAGIPGSWTVNGSALRVTSYEFDNVGRRTEQIVDPSGALKLKTAYSYDKNSNLVSKIDANQQIWRYAFDKNNRMQYSISPDGAVSENRFDKEGRVLKQISFATRLSPAQISLLGNTTTSASVSAMVTVKPDSDQITTNVYDGDGRLTHTFNALNEVTEYSYDAANRVIETVKFAKRLSSSFLGSEPTSHDLRVALRSVWSSDLNNGTAGLVLAAPPHVTYSGQAILLGSRYAPAVSFPGVSANGRQYATSEGAVGFHFEVNTGPSSGRWVEAGASGVTRLSAYLVGDDLVANIIDGAGQRNVALGKIKANTTYIVEVETRTDGAVLNVFEKGKAPSTGFSYSYSGSFPTASLFLCTYLGPGALAEPAFSTVDNIIEYRTTTALTDPSDQRTKYSYDAAGRLTQTTDAENRSERYEYDAAGNRNAVFNKNNQKWTYQFDAAGRVVRETSEPATISTVSGSGVVSTISAPKAINYEYDSLGRVRFIYEGYLQGGVTFRTSRTTEYQYDQRGLQVRVIHAAVAKYNRDADEARGYLQLGRHETTPVTGLETRTVFDDRGQAIVSRDIGGRFSYRYYDASGRLSYEIDAERYLTAYIYDGNGNLRFQSRFKSRVIDDSVGSSDPFRSNLVSRELEVNSSSDPNGSSTRAAAIDAWTQLKSRADLIVSGSLERRTITSEYDSVNRKTGVTLPSVSYFDSASGVYGQSSPSTKFEYDAFGQLIVEAQSISSSDAVTSSYGYDLAGRRIHEINGLGYYTKTQYDAFGRRSQVTEYAQSLGITQPLRDFSALPPVTSINSSQRNAIGYDRIVAFTYDRLDRERDQILVDGLYSEYDGSGVRKVDGTKVLKSTGYDALGNVVTTTDGLGAVTTNYYDKLGRLVGVREPTRAATGEKPLTTYRHDALGNVVQEIKHAAANVQMVANGSTFLAPTTSDTNEQRTVYRYDALGRLTETIDAESKSEFRSYDEYGNLRKLWRNQLVGLKSLLHYLEIYSYDRLGRQISTEYVRENPQNNSALLDVYASQFNSYGEQVAKGVYQAGQTAVYQEFYDYDAAGRLWQTNGDGVTKAYEYDLRGSVTASVTLPSVADTSPNQLPSTVRLTSPTQVRALPSKIRSEMQYDRLGRLTETREQSFSQSPLSASDGGPVSLNETKPATVVSFGSTPSGGGAITHNVSLSWPSVASLGATSVSALIGITYANGTSGTFRFGVLLDHGGGYGSTGLNFAWSLVNNQPAISSINSVAVSVVINGTERLVRVKGQGNSAIGLYLSNINSEDIIQPTLFYRKANSAGGFSSTTFTPALSNSEEFYPRYFRAATPVGDGEYEYYFDAPEAVSGTFSGSPPTVRYRGTFDVVNGEATNFGSKKLEALAPVRQQVYDRWGNAIQVKDPRNLAAYVTEYRYDHGNRVIQELKPEVIETSELGNPYKRPKTEFLYDINGRKIAAINPRSLLEIQRYDESGNLTKEIHSDGGVSENTYNALGQLILTKDAIGNLTSRRYDKLDRLTRQETLGYTAGNERFSVFTYDELGNRASVTNSNGETQSYIYDARGNVVLENQPLNVYTPVSRLSYVYDSKGRLIQKDLVASSPVTSGSYFRETWTYDYFGRLIDSIDLSTAHTEYYYDDYSRLSRKKVAMVTRVIGYGESPNQQVKSVTIGGSDLKYEYYSNGWLKRTSELNQFSEMLERYNEYRYDLAGNRIYERYADVVGKQSYQETRLQYDALGRVERLVDKDYVQSTGYDLAGNKTRIRTRYFNDAGSVVTADNWYAYDSQNRIIRAKGQKVGLSIVGGTELGYDAVGNRRFEKSADNFILFDYNKSNQLTQTRISPYSTGGVLTSERVYDRAGRVIQYTDYGPAGGAPVATRKMYYNANGWLIMQDNYKGDGTADASTRFSSAITEGQTTLSGAPESNRYAGALGNYNAFGDTNQYRVVVKNGENSFTNTYEYQYLGIGSRLKEVVQVASTSVVNYKKGITLTNYDAHGNIKQITDSDGGADTRDYIVKPDGTILLKVVDYNSEIDGTEREQYFFANDQLIGSKGATVDFDLNYTPVSETYPTASPGTYVARGGETLQDIARAFYGDASLWYLIADANGLFGNDSVIAGQSLLIPNRITNIRNSSETFVPYSSSKAIGDTRPTLQYVPPPPPSRRRCQNLLRALVIVVAVAVTIYTAGATTALLLPAAPGAATVVAVGAASGAVGAAAGSAASQFTAGAVGFQTDFSFSAVGRAAVGGAVTGGIAAGLNSVGTGLSGAAANFTNAALGNALEQGINYGLDRQDGFNWTSFAAASITATLVGNRTGERGRDSLGGVSRGFASDFARTATGQFVNRSITMAIQGRGKFDFVGIAADAFGNALGNSIVGALQAKPAAKPSAKGQAQSEAGEIYVPEKMELMELAALPEITPLAELPTVNPDPYVVQSGDSISGILGTSDPAAVGAFMRANGLTDSTIHPGDRLVLPSGDYSRADAALGQATLNADNGRLMALTKQASSVGGTVPFYLDPNSAGKVGFMEASMALRQWQDAQAQQSGLASLTGGAEMSASISGAGRSLSGYDKFSLAAHTGLSLGGAVPGLGIVPDAVDYLYTAAEIPFGKSSSLDLGLAGLGIAGTLAPFSGDTAAAAAKIAAREGQSLFKLGSAFEDSAVRAAGTEAFEQGQMARRLSVRALDENGNLLRGRTVLDAAGTRLDSGEFGALEFKLSTNAPYTERQLQHFPNLAQYGGVVVGNNGVPIGLPAGSVLQPFNVNRINGPGLPGTGRWW